jgi:predicted ATPase
VGPYRLVGELGRGGMGVVHRAFDERLRREVALKALPDELAGDAEQLARLEHEARALAAVNHPNVATIHGMRQAEGVTYLVLELVPGGTLHDRLAHGALPLAEALDLCGQVAAGLSAVHRKGLVHRDLKPSNVMVTPEGTVKLLDFGLARRALPRAVDGSTWSDDVAGTPGFMSPEQLRGEELDARADAFAWGCLLFECLTGVPAFAGDSWAECAAATLEREPAWARLPADLSPDVRALLEGCLSKDREGRPATLASARRVLERASLSSGERRALAALPEHALPAERDAFVGREAELEELTRLVDGGARLVSVLGLGGTGKTRLALHFAWRRLADFPGGTWFCDLSEARSVEGIARAVARTLDVPLGNEDPVVQLGHAIAGHGRCLVVLDNFEQVARHSEATLGRWLDRAEEAVFVVTSREVLGLAGQQHLVLEPLAQADAEELFVLRARAARRELDPVGGERREVAELVRVLDHLPLAIELAAARVRVMSVAQVLSRMNERFKLLAGSGARQDRQATLRATLDWSWDLLSDWEQSALAQLSVFEGGFTLEAAEAVLDLTPFEDAPWTVDVVQALVDKSLLHRVQHDRLEPLVTVQEYAAGRLDALGDRPEAERRHGSYFAAFGAVEAIDALDRHGGVERRRALACDLDNVVAACRRAVARRDEQVAVAALAAAWAVLVTRGPFVAGVELAESVGEVAISPKQRMRAEGILGGALLSHGRTEEARVRLESALAAHRQSGDRRSEEVLLGLLGLLHWSRNEREQARACHEAALAIARELGDRGAEGKALGHVGVLRLDQDDMTGAGECYAAALDLHRDVGDRLREGVMLGNLAVVHQRQGRADEARAGLQAALTIAREVGDRRAEGVVLANLGNFHLEQGRPDESRACYDAALATDRQVGDRRAEAAGRRPREPRRAARRSGTCD